MPEKFDGKAGERESVSGRRPGYEQMAQSIHGSYLRRWNRHDPKAIEVTGPDGPGARQPARRVSAA